MQIVHLDYNGLAIILIEDTYSWDPTNYGDKENIIGIEACIWTETIGNAEALDYMVYPKILRSC